MPSPVFARRFILAGAGASIFGTVLYSQLGLIAGLRTNLPVLDIAVVSSLSTTLLGVLALLIGGGIWAWRAPLIHLLVSGASMGISAFLLIRLADINIHGPTAILIFVVIADALGGTLILLIALRRFAFSQH
jgi:hypothetical protein